MNKLAVGLSSIVAEVREQEATRQKPERARKQMTLYRLWGNIAFGLIRRGAGLWALV